MFYLPTMDPECCDSKLKRLDLYLCGLPSSLAMLYMEFLIKYYGYSFDYLITITNQFTINAHT